MADEPTNPTPPAPDAAPPSYLGRARAWLAAHPKVSHALATLLAALLTFALTEIGAPKPVVETLPPIIVPLFVGGPADGPPPEYAQTFGWQRDDEAIAANLDPVKTIHFETTPAGKAMLGDGDVYLWRAVRKVNAGKPADWYPNVNQQNVGCCVGCGWKHCADVCQATAILAGQAFEWKPVSVEAIYGNSRVDIGRGRISGDGSVGAWAKGAVEKDGIAPMQKYASADLSTFSPSRARDWGRRGVPKDVNDAARGHPVKGCALVKSWVDVKKSIQQGYPVAVCSDQGFTMQRDATGRCRPQGSWSHCMSIIGVRSAEGGVAEGGFILNSWGDNAHTGPTWPEDAPKAGFWAGARVIDRMVSQGDSFALADVAGFPKRVVPLDWNIRARPRPRDPFARLRDAEFALAH